MLFRCLWLFILLTQVDATAGSPGRIVTDQDVTVGAARFDQYLDLLKEEDRHSGEPDFACRKRSPG